MSGMGGRCRWRGGLDEGGRRGMVSGVGGSGVGLMWVDDAHEMSRGCFAVGVMIFCDGLVRKRR